MIDLRAMTQEELIRIIAELQACNEQMARHIVRLEGHIVHLEEQITMREGSSHLEAVSKPERASPSLRIKPSRPKTEQKPRSKRTHTYGRKRSKPTRQVTHAVDRCPECGCGLCGGSIKRRREVLHIPLVPLEVIEHLFIERRCPVCGKRQTPSAAVLHGEVLGKHRVSLQTMAMIATLREEGRLPINMIQWLLQAFYGLELSQGEIVAILQAAAKHGQSRVVEMREQLKSSPVVHGDETTWRENGQNGYFWSFSTPQISYFEYRHSRSGQIVEDVMGQALHTTVTCDFYGAYNRHHGPLQRCWAHLLRAIHELKMDYPDNEQVQLWGKAIHTLYLEACSFRDRHRDGDWLERYTAARRFQSELLALCEPFLEKEVPQRILCKRCKQFINQLFQFVVDPRVPATNNAAERAVRPLAVSRKISGGTRSPEGSKTKGILASLFTTWRLQGLNPLVACSQLLASPQI